MTDLLKHPLWLAEDLGTPIPEWPHATSVCLPRWADNIDYERCEPRVLSKLTCGYPRFVYHAFVRKLFDECREKFANSGQIAVVFPSAKIAQQCVACIGAGDAKSEIRQCDNHGLSVLLLPAEFDDAVKKFWQHAGAGVSSRHAETVITEGRTSSQKLGAARVKPVLRDRIAEILELSADDVYLYPSGMSAFFNTHLVLESMTPDTGTVQFGFPYVDALKIQEKYGKKVQFYHRGDHGDLNALSEFLDHERICGLFTEFPMNPLLTSPDLTALVGLAEKHGFPIVVDDTLGTFHNLQVLPPADILVTSLTKFFSGAGNVMAGSVVLNHKGAFYRELKQRFDLEFEDNLWWEDAVVLEENSRQFSARMRTINKTTEKLCMSLQDDPRIEHVFYPKFEDVKNYDRYRKPDGGYSGVFSILLKHPERTAPPFFDALRICKGPSLGTNFTLACPYTILAHFDELPFAERCGISRHLIRASVGLEEYRDLQSRFQDALSKLGY